jgi:ELWxxDGT repeat protein
MRTLRYFSVLLLLLAMPAAAGGPAHLVADLKATGFDSPDPSSALNFSSYVAVNGRVVFFGFLPEQGSAGCGLWATDGTPGGAERLADLCGGVGDLNNSKLRMLAAGGRVAWFEDVAGGLWRTDGTRAGTYPLGVQLGYEGFSPSRPVVGPDGKTLFFVGCAPPALPGILQDCEPWRSDGSRQGTRRIADLNPGAAGSNPSNFTRQGQRVLFLALGSLWSTDGTAAGTRALVQLPSSYAASYLVHGSLIYLNAGGEVRAFNPRTGKSWRLGIFPAYDNDTHPGVLAGVVLEEAAGRVFLYQFNFENSSYSLWETDGTRAGTRRIAPPRAFNSADGRLFGVAGGRVVFASAQSGWRQRLWSLDPGTRHPVLLDGCPEGCPDTDLSQAVVFHGRLYFTGADPGHGRELWETDGTAQGTRRVKDLCPGACDGGPVQLGTALGRLVFTDPRGDLWASDGTAAGTVRLAATGATPSPYLPLDVAVLGGRIFFTGLDPASGRQPFASDLTPQGTDVLDHIGGLLAASSQPLALSPVGARVVFAACSDDTAGYWGSDGTAAGTVLLPGTEQPCGQYGYFGIFEPAGSFSYFRFGDELWRTDGTAGGTLPLIDLAPGAHAVQASLGDKLLLMVASGSGSSGYDLAFWISDGTPAGTREAFTRRVGTLPDPFSIYTYSVGGLVFFISSEPGSPDGIWRTDGTEAGTFPVLEGLFNSGYGYEIASAGGKIFFSALTRGDVGFELWVTDGAAPATQVFPDADGPRNLLRLVGFRNAVYFTAESGDPNHPARGLWRSDGTAAGTYLVKALEPSVLTGFAVAGDQLFFQADDGVSGAELWKTDGTRAGTVLVKDLAPGAASSRPENLTAAGGRLYFTATDGVSGNELWVTDGTAAGTRLVQDILPGPASANPESLTAADGVLYFTANDGEHGRELWALPLPK